MLTNKVARSYSDDKLHLIAKQGKKKFKMTHLQ